MNKYFVDDYKSSFICCLFTYFEKSLEMIQQKHWMLSFLKENWISVYLLYLDSANIFQIYHLGFLKKNWISHFFRNSFSFWKLLNWQNFHFQDSSWYVLVLLCVTQIGIGNNLLLSLSIISIHLWFHKRIISLPISQGWNFVNYFVNSHNSNST